MLFNIFNVLFHIHCSKELPIDIKIDNENHIAIKVIYKDKLQHLCYWAITCMYCCTLDVSDWSLCVTCSFKYLVFNVKSVKKDVFFF